MTIIAPTRLDALLNEDGTPDLRFASYMEEMTEAVNDADIQALNTQDSSYTFVLDDANKIIRKTSMTGAQTYTIPANARVSYLIGTTINIQNDGTVALLIAITDDTLTSSAGLGTGTRMLAPSGEATIVKVAATSWKIKGEQLT